MARDSGQMIHGVAVDAGSGLEAAIREARGTKAQADDLLTFKRCVVEALGPHATTVLVDANSGPALLGSYPHNCEKMIAYEADVYHISDDDRMTVLPENITISDYLDMDVNLLKFFMYYAPDGDPNINERKRNLVAKIGADCKEKGISFLMEPLVYHPTIEPGSADYAAIKPDLVRRATEVFAREEFNADVLKVEIPVDLNFVEGFGEAAMSHADALLAFQNAAAPAKNRRMVYLSAGVSFEWFDASLALAREAGVDFNGFMCGRAIWSDAVGIFGAEGQAALRDWLAETGRARIEKLIATVS